MITNFLRLLGVALILAALPSVGAHAVTTTSPGDSCAGTFGAGELDCVGGCDSGTCQKGTATGGTPCQGGEYEFCGCGPKGEPVEPGCCHTIKCKRGMGAPGENGTCPECPLNGVCDYSGKHGQAFCDN